MYLYETELKKPLATVLVATVPEVYNKNYNKLVGIVVMMGNEKPQSK
jgi:hypothetical protein